MSKKTVVNLLFFALYSISFAHTQAAQHIPAQRSSCARTHFDYTRYTFQGGYFSEFTTAQSLRWPHFDYVVNGVQDRAGLSIATYQTMSLINSPANFRKIALLLGAAWIASTSTLIALNPLSL